MTLKEISKYCFDMEYLLDRREQEYNDKVDLSFEKDFWYRSGKNLEHGDFESVLYEIEEHGYTHFDERFRKLLKMIWEYEDNVKRKCTFEGCDKPHSAKGLCMGHYGQLRTGKELKPLFAYEKTYSIRKMLEKYARRTAK